jgi:hypothetical protein
MYLETHYENVDHTQVGGTFSAGGQFSGVHKTFHAEQWSELHDVITPTDYVAPVETWVDKRTEAYGSWQEQLDMMYHETWKDHVKSVKDENPKE